MTLSGYRTLITLFFYDFNSPFPIEKINQALKTVFNYFTKHLDVSQKYSATCPISNCLLGVWKGGETRSFAFNISDETVTPNIVSL